MPSSALGLPDLVAAMPAATAVIDQWGRTITANQAWLPLAGDVAPLFGAATTAAGVSGAGEPESVRLTGAAAQVRAVLQGERDAVEVDALVGGREMLLQVVAIGEGASYSLAVITPVHLPAPAPPAAPAPPVAPMADVTPNPTVQSAAGVDQEPSEVDATLRTNNGALPGRELFCELLAQASTMSARHGFIPVVLAVVIDGLDHVEANHGAEARRDVLVAMASRFKSGLRPSDFLAQPDSESFLVLLPDVDSIETAEHIAHRLCVEQSQPFRVGDRRLHVSIRVGIAGADPRKSAEAVVSAATEALDATTPLPDHAVIDLTGVEPGGERDELRVVSVANAQRRRDSLPRPVRKIDLREMKDEELISYYQPIFDVRNDRVVAGEALMRWRHPHYGVLSAGEFLGLAINASMLATLTDQALVRATETWAEIRDGFGPVPPRLFVNLSPEQLLSRVAVDRLYHLLVATGLPPADVVVEVTEEAMATRFGEMISVLAELRDQGLHVALDDFGSGYSSLGRLRHLPVDVIKVDQSMVRGLETDRRARQLLAAVSTMATELDVDCIVEGIETAAEADIVVDLGFRYLQGYFFARPCSADDFVALVKRSDAAAVAPPV